MDHSTPKPKHPQVQRHVHAHSIRAQAQASPSTVSKPSTAPGTPGSFAKGKGKAKDEFKGSDKVVYKTLLEGPNKIKWPNTPNHLQHSVLALLGELLVPSGLAEYHVSRGRLSHAARQRKRRKEDKQDREAQLKVMEEKHKESDSDGVQFGSVSGIGESSKAQQAPPKHDLPMPAIEEHLVVGINEITKLIESKISTALRPEANPNPVVFLPSSQPKVVFVCRTDVNPPALVDHFPPMLAALNGVDLVLNSGRSNEGCYLVQLPKGAEYKLAEWTGLRRCSAMLLLDSCPELTSILDHLKSSNIAGSFVPRAKWLEPILPLNFLNKLNGHNKSVTIRRNQLPQFLPTQPQQPQPPHTQLQRQQPRPIHSHKSIPPQQRKPQLRQLPPAHPTLPPKPSIASAATQRELLPMRIKLLKTTKKMAAPKQQKQQKQQPAMMSAGGGGTVGKRKADDLAPAGQGKVKKVRVEPVRGATEEEDEMNGMNC